MTTTVRLCAQCGASCPSLASHLLCSGEGASAIKGSKCWEDKEMLVTSFHSLLPAILVPSSELKNAACKSMNLIVEMDHTHRRQTSRVQEHALMVFSVAAFPALLLRISSLQSSIIHKKKLHSYPCSPVTKPALQGCHQLKPSVFS